MANNKHNILLVANWESDVGYAWWLMENFWVSISDHFATKGCSCYLIYPKITHLPASISAANITTSELDFRDHRLANLLKIRRFIRSNSIRYLYLSDSACYSRFYLLLRFFGIKKIVMHDHTPGDRPMPPAWIKIIKNLIQSTPLFSADHFVAVSNYVNRRHREIFMIPAIKCSIAANGIHPYDLSLSDKNYAHKQFSIPQNRRIIVNTGRASSYKGIDFYIECANELINNQGLEQLHFLFCGDGPELEQFKSLCKAYELDEHFTFAGKRSDIQKILPSCDLGFHASHGEVGYSLSILEYMSAGLATIVPDRPSTCDATRHMETGLLYEHNSTSSACDAIKKCLSDELKNKLTANAIKEIKLYYDIDKTNEKLISSLDAVYE